MLKKDYLNALIRGLRLVPYVEDNQPLTEESLTKAMTLNENLKSIGYTMLPKDIVAIAKSSTIDTLYDVFKNAVGEVKAKPMYPDFPNQVMEMDEATFRFHQIVHYFSTYGMEWLTGEPVLKGWVPSVKDTEKTEEDETLLKAKVFHLVPEKDMYVLPMKKILSKRERMTIIEAEIVGYASQHVDASVLDSIEIPFKENFLEISWIVFKNNNAEQTLSILKSLCSHSGDAFRICDYIIGKSHYKLRTSQRKMLVRLLESFPVYDFKANLILSLKKAKRTHVVLNNIGFTYYSRSEEHKNAVHEFRNGELKSWEGQMKMLLAEDKNNNTHSISTIEFIAKKPGMLLRMVNWLCRLDYDRDLIMQKLAENIEKLSAQTILTVLTTFGRLKRGYANIETEKTPEEIINVYEIFYSLMEKKISTLDTPLRNKKVYLEQEIYDFDLSTIECNNKSQDGEYVHSGIAYKIPEEVNRMRFFVYWNHHFRTDIDLHGFFYRNDRTQVTHVGWNESYRRDGLVMSGDMTQSDSAEYIDIDMEEAKTGYLGLSINSFTGIPFGEYDECFTGMLAVKSLGEKVKLYNPKNCFFSHNIKSNAIGMTYAIIDVEKRVLVYLGKSSKHSENVPSTESVLKEIYSIYSDFSVAEYLKLLSKTQNVEFVENKEDTDIVLSLDKTKDENNISLIDENFFLEAPVFKETVEDEKAE